MALISPESVVYLTPRLSLHAMERGLRGEVPAPRFLPVKFSSAKM
jgi:hypothetical protein